MCPLPSNQVMYAAFVNKDSLFEGIFFAGIKTTGIFCRPTCPAKKPRPQNVEFFASAQAALAAGYRPCARCHPLETSRKPELVNKLQSLIANSYGKRLTNMDLKRMGIDPSTASRQFKQSYGMSFQAYQRAQHMAAAWNQIRRGEKVIQAQVTQGYSSASGFWLAFSKVMGEAPHQASSVNILNAGWIETPLGPMLALADEFGLHLLEFTDCQGLDQYILSLRNKTGSVIVPAENAVIELAEKQLHDYFCGRCLNFRLPIVMHGSEFDRAVWRLLQEIPPGETWSYQKVAACLNQPYACRAVGNANHRNRLVLVIPCHRVVRADGSLGGYGGGTWRKRWLLNHEQNMLTV